jgi:hypothetical protein
MRIRTSADLSNLISYSLSPQEIDMTLVDPALDLDRFRLRPAAKPKATKKRRPPRHKGNEWFLKGPIPGAWLTLAARLPGRALHVALALWYLAGLKKTREVKPTGNTWERFGVSPDAAYRGLRALEAAGLVWVDRRRGRCPLVKILEAPS